MMTENFTRELLKTKEKQWPKKKKPTHYRGNNNWTNENQKAVTKHLWSAIEKKKYPPQNFTTNKIPIEKITNKKTFSQGKIINLSKSALQKMIKEFLPYEIK